jgi:hypothetical protein
VPVTWPDHVDRLIYGDMTAGEPLPDQPPPSQDPPRKGTEPRVNLRRAVRRARRHPFVLLAYRGADGYPFVVPVSIESGRFQLGAAPWLMPPGERRAGLVSHDYEQQLRGIATRQFTGWLVSWGSGQATYSPHTEQGFRAPTNKSLLLLANGFVAKRGLRKARREGSLERLEG